MTNDDLITHFNKIGWAVSTKVGIDGQIYVIIHDYEIAAGSFAGQTCDIAIAFTKSVPYVAPAAIHTRPVLLPMGQRNTMQSGVGPEWQYWSRCLRGQPTPQSWVAHIATIFSEV